MTIGLTYLILSILASTFISHTMKFSQHRGVTVLSLMLVNYALAAGVAFVALQGRWELMQSPALIIIGLVLGIFYATTLIFLDAAIQRLGLTIPTAMMRMSAVIPTLGSMFLFAEQPDLYKSLGIILAFCALPLASKDPIFKKEKRQAMLAGAYWSMLLFFSYGIALFLFKVQTELVPLPDPAPLLVIIFCTAFVFTWVIFLRKQIRLTKPALVLGSVLGLSNIFSSYTLLGALEFLPGVVVYPSVSIGVILLTGISSLIIWKETLRSANYVFVVLATISLVLINLKL